MKAVRGGGVKRGDVCYGMLRAAACVDESDHRDHAVVPAGLLHTELVLIERLQKFVLKQLTVFTK